MSSIQISQTALVVGITKHLEKTEKVKTFIPRQFNAIVTAANLIVAEFAKPVVMATPGMGLAAWLASDDTGISSKFMAHASQGHWGEKENHWPLDADDFGRCVRLLDASPQVRKVIPLMAERKDLSPQWRAIAGHWAELEALYRSGSFKTFNVRLKEITTEAKGSKP